MHVHNTIHVHCTFVAALFLTGENVSALSDMSSGVSGQESCIITPVYIYIWWLKYKFIQLYNMSIE